ncbi:MAG TPA: hypothetical protein VFN85_06605 [Solirubrobacterales bacterium]|nr:hypothetical protein [Solirubrobacterales bacterium]
MEAVRDKWTDERLDDLNARMGKGFDRLDKDIRELRSEVAGVRGEMSDRFEATHRLIIQVGGGLFGTMAIGFVGLIVTMVFTQS